MAFDQIEANNQSEQISQLLLECSERAVVTDIKRRIMIIREEVSKGQLNNTLALRKLAMLSNENPSKEVNLVNHVQEFYSKNPAFNNVFTDNKLNDFFFHKNECYMFADRKDVDDYVSHCLESSIDPVALANIKIDRKGINEYETEKLIIAISNVSKTIKSTDLRSDFSVINDYIVQLEHSVFTVSVVGEVNSGKSTIINTIIGMNLAFTNVETCTAVPVVYENDITYSNPILLLGEDFRKYGLADRYEGEEIAAVLQNLNGIVRDNSVKLNINQWPVVKVRFNGINGRIRIIDTPGISETDPTLLEYAKQALARSVCIMVTFPCDKINTTSENTIKAYTESNINKGKHLCLIANRWDEYEKGLDLHEKQQKKEDLKERFKSKGYEEVFITTGNNAFHTSQMDKILQSGRKPEWSEAMIWADKCLSNAVTTLEDLEDDYEELTMKKLQRMVAKVLTNSGVTGLVNYLDTGLIKNIQGNTVLYISNSLIKELSLFDSLKGPIRDSGIKSIFNVEQQLKMNNNNRALFNKSLSQWKDHIFTKKERLTRFIAVNSIKMTDYSRDSLYYLYESVKLEVEKLQRKSSQLSGCKMAAKDTIAEDNQKDIIFFKDQEHEVKQQIFQIINKRLPDIVKFWIMRINDELSETLQALKAELRNSCDDWNIVSFIDEVEIHDYIFDTESVMRITNIATYKVQVKRPFISRLFGPKLRESRDRLCIKKKDFKCSVDVIVNDLMIKFDDTIHSHLSHHIADFTSYIEKGSKGILDDIDTNIHRFQNDKAEAVKGLELRIWSDLRLNACSKIMEQIKSKCLVNIVQHI
ncbi:hypothetical protein K7432_010943 [Basidiobolus ranarum]|uniref:Dynamin N-terminal domain-containing protein n=1 Tax=Basidiobolus ranarum TaxID=34480 RepID=A0ABR2WN35_9FUNG